MYLQVKQADHTKTNDNFYVVVRQTGVEKFRPWDTSMRQLIPLFVFVISAFLFPNIVILIFMRICTYNDTTLIKYIK